MSLNYKHIPFVTKYLDYHEIQDKVKSIGGTPSPFGVQSVNGSLRYTVPTIHDTNTGAVVTNSTAIAEYLDKTYPDSPSGPLFPHGSHAAITLFEQTFMSAKGPLYHIMAPFINKVMTPACQEFHRSLVEASLQKKLEELPRLGTPEHEASMQKVQEGLNQLAKLYERNGKDSLWFLGDTFSFADIIAASFFLGFKIFMGEESEEWKRVASWDEGRWVKLVDATKILSGESTANPPEINRSSA